MPKLTGPLLSVDAHGALGKALTYQRRLGGASVYGYKQPKVPLTAKQFMQRWLIANAVACWKALSDEDKAVWELKAKGRGQSGYSLFIHENTAIGYNMYLACDFSVGAGSVLPDLSRFESHGAITGASWADGLYGKCLDFDPGIPSYVEIPADQTQLDFTTEDFSIIARIRIDDLTVSRFIFIRGSWNADGYDFWVRDTGMLIVYTSQFPGNQNSSSAVGAVLINTWYTVGMSRAGASVRVYINGVDATAVVGVHVDPLTSVRSAKIGINDNMIHNPFDGKIEFLRVFGGAALSEADHLLWHNALK